MKSDNNEAPRPANIRRVLLGLVGLVVGFVLLIIGLNTLGQNPDPEPSPRPPRSAPGPGAGGSMPPASAGGSIPGTTQR